MRNFNYSEIKNQKWDSEILGLIAGIYKEAGKQVSDDDAKESVEDSSLSCPQPVKENTTIVDSRKNRFLFFIVLHSLHY